MTNTTRWLSAGVVAAVVAGTVTTQRTQACLFGTCDGLIIANQITQIAHMVTQINRLVDQLSTLDGVLDATTELVTSDDVGMGNIGRLREVFDAEWDLAREGLGLATSTSLGTVGAFSQRIPGLTDEAGWLQVLAAPETALWPRGPRRRSSARCRACSARGRYLPKPPTCWRRSRRWGAAPTATGACGTCSRPVRRPC